MIDIYQKSEGIFFISLTDQKKGEKGEWGIALNQISYMIISNHIILHAKK